MKLCSWSLFPQASRKVKVGRRAHEATVFYWTSLHLRSALSRRRGAPDSDGVPMRQRHHSISRSRGDRLLFETEEPPLGAHLVTPRFAIAHHGIYVGGGNVVHYGAFAHHFQTGPVEEISVAFFAHGGAVFVRHHAAPRFQGAEVIHRARSRLGEDSYCLLRNNCEHFCEWCVQDVHRSYQVEHVLMFPRAVARTVGVASARIRAKRVFDRLLRVLPAE